MTFSQIIAAIAMGMALAAGGVAWTAHNQLERIKAECTCHCDCGCNWHVEAENAAVFNINDPELEEKR